MAKKTNEVKTELRSWRFMLDQQEYGMAHGYALKDYDDSAWTAVETYRPWDCYDAAMKDYEGKGWYRTTFTGAPEGKRSVLAFDGIGGTAEVYVNGHYAGGTGSRYLPFQVDATDYAKAGTENAVAVLVDNAWQGPDHLTGGKKVEWVLYGGLTHRIYMVEQEPVRIDHVFLKAEADGTCHVRMELINQSKQGFSGTVRGRTEGLSGTEFSREVTMEAGLKAVVTFDTKAENAVCWSPDAPKLYKFNASLCAGDTVLYSMEQTYGYRTMEVRGTELYLNGAPILFKGANRYDEYGSYGNCAPLELIREDLLKMKQCGMNFVRTHYCQDPALYDIADEVGMLYMLEVPLNWWRPEPGLDFSNFTVLESEVFDNLNRTFRSYCNHPCWIVWSTGNECAHSHPAVNKMFRLMAARMRELNCGRLISYASNQKLLDGKELDFCDFLGMNYYEGAEEDSAELRVPTLEKLQEKMELAQRLYPNVPHVMTEFGCISVYGLHGNGIEGKATEEFTAAYLERVLKIYMANPQMKGLVVWAWADYYHRWSFVSIREKGIHLRTHYGPYGLVTADRREKKPVLEAICRGYKEFQQQI